MNPTILVLVAVAMVHTPIPCLASAINPARIAQHLHPEDASFRHLEAEIQFPIHERSPGLVIGDHDKASDVRAARRFAAILFRREGLTLNLQQKIDGQSTAAFNGTLTDARNQVVANIKVTELGRWWVDSVSSWLRRVVDKTERYGKEEAWQMFQLKLLRQIARSPRTAPRSQFQLYPSQLGKYQRSVAGTRLMMSMFGVGRDRPTRVLLVCEDSRVRPFEDVVSVAEDLSKGMTAGSQILILFADRLIRIENGAHVVEPLDPCERPLTENAEPT